MSETVEFLRPADLRDTLRGMAVVSLLFDRGLPPPPDHEYRADLAMARAVAVWRDFAGNRCHFLFTPSGNVMLGFDHESPMSPHATCTGPHDFRPWAGVYDKLPKNLMDAVLANPFGPRFDYREVTFCLWNTTTRKVWLKGEIDYPERDYDDPDGMGYVLNRVRGYYEDFAGEFRDVYEWELDEQAVAELLSGDEVSRDTLRRLRPEGDLTSIAAKLGTMGIRVT